MAVQGREAWLVHERRCTKWGSKVQSRRGLAGLTLTNHVQDGDDDDDDAQRFLHQDVDTSGSGHRLGPLHPRVSLTLSTPSSPFPLTTHPPVPLRFIEHIVRYDHVFNKFAEEGIAVFAFDQRGYVHPAPMSPPSPLLTPSVRYQLWPDSSDCQVVRRHLLAPRAR